MKYIFHPLSALAIVLSMGVAAADPTPIPGGSNQAIGVTGTIGSTLFNGEVRLKPTELRDATPADGMVTSSDKKWLVFTATASNGMHRTLNMVQFIASISDADGNTLQAQGDKVHPTGGIFGTPPGGAWKEQVFFDVPAQFTPAKIVLAPYDGKHPVFRITIRPQDYHRS